MKRKHTKQPAAQVPAPQPRREVARLSPDPEQGLTLHQVKERQQNGWANDPVDSPTKTVGQIVRENVFTFFNFIFVVLAALLVAVGSFDDMLFLLIAVANTGIGIVQQLRSKQTVDKLNLLAAPRANVVREGNLISVPAAQLVRDDVAELASGDQIPADATVLSGQVQVNEALITGEADAITKAPGDELLSGAFVVSGRCRARLDRVGAESYAARLTLEAKKDVTVGKSEMMSSLDKLIRIIGILLIPIGVALFVKEFVFLERTAQEAVVSMVAALIGMIPEGLYLLTSVALAVSMIRLAQGKVLAQDMNCIETLAHVDVLCVDKTGTITEPTMEVTDVYPLNSERFSYDDIEKILAAFYHGEEPDNETARADARAQLAWFEQQLKRFRKCNHIFVFTHHPLTVSPDSKVEHKSAFDEPFRTEYAELMKKYGVRAIFAGHTHITGLTEAAGIPMIIAGASSYPLYGAYTGINVVDVTPTDFRSEFIADDPSDANIRLR